MKIWKHKNELAKKVDSLTIEKEFLEGKLVSLLSISLNKQCKLLGISKSSLYYEPVKKFSSEGELELLIIFVSKDYGEVSSTRRYI
ncbi:MAG TPA: hypothetical protein EYG73_11830 [Arcobacter sp.]|nr:hypothetical protein [Arcobacter sp.]